MNEDNDTRWLHIVRGVCLDLDEVREVAVEVSGGIKILLKCGQELAVPRSSVHDGHSLLGLLAERHNNQESEL